MTLIAISVLCFIFVLCIFCISGHTVIGLWAVESADKLMNERMNKTEPNYH